MKKKFLKRIGTKLLVTILVVVAATGFFFEKAREANVFASDNIPQSESGLIGVPDYDFERYIMNDLRNAINVAEGLQDIAIS
ncbi:MAG: hypothetical protein LBQ27_04410 [Clostridiales bacterium]|jgi:hypothetical protein|nr:hypothetical protein [Clostridiales bacterium]